MRLALAQINTVVGDLDGNRDADPASASTRRASAGADLVLFPELAVTGYPPEDLLLRPGFVRAAERVARRDRARVPRHRRARRRPALRPRPLQRVRRLRRRRGRRRSTASASCRTTASSTRTATSRPARDLLLLEHGDTLVGPTICEDIWQPGPPATDLALAGAQLSRTSPRRRSTSARTASARRCSQTRARDNACFVAFCNAGRRPGRADLRRPLARARRRGRGARARARVRGGAARRRRRAGGRGRAAAARRPPPRARAGARRRSAEVPVVPHRRRRAERRPDRAGRRRRRSEELEQMRLALELGLARLRAARTASRDVVVGVSGGIDSARHGRARRRGARAGARPLRLDAVALLVRGDARRRAARSPRASAPTFLELPIGAIVERVRRDARGGVRGPRARPHRGEPPGARSAASC